MSSNSSMQRFRFWFLIIWGICFFSGISLAIYNFAIKGNQYWRFIETAPADLITKIEFYSMDDNYQALDLIQTITDYNTIEKISGYLTEASPYSPNHPHYVKDTYSILYLKNGDEFEFVFHLMEYPSNTVYIDFVGKNGAATSFYGHAKIKDQYFLDLLNLLDLFQE